MVMRNAGPIIRLGRRTHDNLAYLFGNDDDVAMVLNTATLAADTTLTLIGNTILEGTPVSEALAANSLLLSNITNDSDIAFYISRGGNSAQFLFMDGSAGVLYLMANVGGIMAGFAADPPAPDVAGLHIWRGSAGTVTAGTSATLTLESSNTSEQSIYVLSPSTALFAIYIKSSNDNVDLGGFEYRLGGHATPSTFAIVTANAARALWNATTLEFQQAESITTTSGALTLNPATEVVIAAGDRLKVGGTAAHATTPGTNEISLFEGTAPVGTLADGGTLYVRDAAGVTELSFIDSGGTVSNLT